MINWLRRQFCKHEFESRTINTYWEEYSDLPIRSRMVLVCTKCGYVRRIRL